MSKTRETLAGKPYWKAATVVLDFGQCGMSWRANTMRSLYLALSTTLLED